MGTRGTYGFKKDGKYKVAYNHYDSYPDELGEKVLMYIKTRDIMDLHNIFNEIRLVNDYDKVVINDIDKYREFSDYRVNGGKLDSWYCLLRNMQGDLEAHERAEIMLDGVDSFNEEEYDYLIDLDDENFVIFSHGNHVVSFPLDQLPKTLKGNY